MTDREKIVELLNEAHDAFYANFDPMKSYMGSLADCLIANGFRSERKQATSDKTSEWVSVKDRLPEDDAQVLACTKHGKSFSAHCEKGKWRVSHSVKITHWMPLPTPPLDTTKQEGNL